MEGPVSSLRRSLLRLDALLAALGIAILVVLQDQPAVRFVPALVAVAVLGILLQVLGRVPPSRLLWRRVDLRLAIVTTLLLALCRFADPLTTPIYLVVSWFGVVEAARSGSRWRPLMIPGVPMLAMAPALLFRPPWMPPLELDGLREVAVGLPLLVAFGYLVLVLSWRERRDAGAMAREQGRLGERRQQERRIIQQLDEPVLLLDAGYGIVGSNPSAREQLGDDIEGVHLRDAVRTPEEHEPIPKGGEGGSPEAFHSVEIHPTRGPAAGQRWSMDIRRLPADADEHARWVVVLHRSSTMLEKVRHHEDRLAELQAAARRRTEFLRLMSHELRNPLHAMLGFSDLLVEDEVEPMAAAQLERLTAVRHTGRHLQRILDDVRKYVSLGERPPAARAAFDLTELVDEAVQMVMSSAEREELDVELISPPVPVTALGDEEMTRRALLNLLTNAIRFNQPGGLIRVNTTTGPGHCSVQIEDSGVGIPWLEQGRVFEPFDRGDADSGGGVGMGLTIARRLMQLQGGTISLRSRPGHGSTFTLGLASPGETLVTPDPLFTVDLPGYDGDDLVDEGEV